jgi:[protein-PII] uridylyltransferase
VTSHSLAEIYAVESAKIRERFESDGDGRAAVEARSDLMDQLITRLFGAILDAGGGVSLVALGGYGRRQLFPYSDIDLLLLVKSQRALETSREPFAALTRALWDLGLRVGSTARTAEECGKLDRKNLEFSISLLDSRHLAGDASLTSRLHETMIPRLVARDRAALVADLVEMSRKRHEKFGDTIFHLEPHVKDAPGGLRDYHVARWLSLLRELGARRRWAKPEDLWPKALAGEAAEALPFLTDVRTFVHYAYGRDDNQLSYELQEKAAHAGVGVPRGGTALSPAEWMRIYFLRARAIGRLVRRLLDEAAPRRSSLLGRYRKWKLRSRTPGFSVTRGELSPRHPEITNLPSMLAAFELVAEHGLELGQEAEHWAEQAVRKIGPEELPQDPALWNQFRNILAAPEASRALRAMHRLGLLSLLFPEFRAVDALVLRDFYHRYTVDEHSLRTIENLGKLGNWRRNSRPSGPRTEALEPRQAGDTGWEPQFAELLAELEQPEVLRFSLLFHDVGKGMAASDHVVGSLAAVEQVFTRFALAPEEQETVRFLISRHLEMSRTVQRRDIFAPETVREFAEKVGTPERLKMLTLLTYADIKSVNPEALTSWKAEMLWQLYTATSNYFSRSLDEERVRAAADSTAQAAAMESGVPEEARRQFAGFLEGFPRRYLRSHAREVILRHFRMQQALETQAAQIQIEDHGRLWELTVLTRDRPFLFASLTGTLAAWGMNILKADAFANARGIVLDIFRFEDAHRTLELNPGEIGRFRENLDRVLAGRESVERLLARRAAPRGSRTKVRIPLQVRFEQPPSLEGHPRTTLVELIAHDRPGLLYQVSSAIAELHLNIEVALIDTEGEKVIDVFYLTEHGGPLAAATQKTLGESLRQKLEARS